LGLTIAAAEGTTVSVSPKRGGLTVGQTITNLTATLTGDTNKGVNWTISPNIAGNLQSRFGLVRRGPANNTYAISVPGTGDGSSSGQVPFNTCRHASELSVYGPKPN